MQRRSKEETGLGSSSPPLCLCKLHPLWSSELYRECWGHSSHNVTAMLHSGVNAYPEMPPSGCWRPRQREEISIPSFQHPRTEAR